MCQWVSLATLTVVSPATSSTRVRPIWRRSARAIGNSGPHWHGWPTDSIPGDAAARHPVLGPCGVLIERWCERRALFPLAQLLPAYVQGPQGLSAWKSLLAGLERLDRVAAGTQLLPDDEREMLSQLLQETKRIVRTGEED